MHMDIHVYACSTKQSQKRYPFGGGAVKSGQGGMEESEEGTREGLEEQRGKGMWLY